MSEEALRILLAVVEDYLDTVIPGTSEDAIGYTEDKIDEALESARLLYVETLVHRREEVE